MAKTTLTHTTVVTGADAQALAANGRRNFLLLENLDVAGTNHIFVAFGVTAVINQGIRLPSVAGGAKVMFDMKVSQQAIRAVAAAGTPTLLITEGIGP